MNSRMFPALRQHVLDPLLKLAPVLAARHDAAHVQGENPLAHQHLGDVPLHNALGQPLHHGALAHAGLADENGVVLRAADEDLDDPLDFLVPADDRIQLVVFRRPGQVAGVLGQYGGIALVLALGIVLGHAGIDIGAAVSGVLHADALDQLLPGPVEIHPQLLEDAGSHAVPLPEDRQPEVLRADVGLPQPAALQDGQLQQLFRPGGQLKPGGAAHQRHVPAVGQQLPHLILRDPVGNGGRYVALVQQPHENMLRSHVGLVHLRRRPLGRGQRPLGALGKSSKDGH